LEQGLKLSNFGSKIIIEVFFWVAKLDPKLDSWVPFMCGKVVGCSF
jgi:hypothetical protein